MYYPPDGDGAASCEFTIVSLDGKRWRWEVCGASGMACAAERDAWVACGSADTAVATGTGETISFAYHIFLFLRM